MNGDLTQEASRLIDFFQLMERMFVPLPPGGVSVDIKKQIFHQVYRSRIGVEGRAEPRFRLNAGIMNSLLSLYRFPATVDDPFTKFLFPPSAGSPDGSNEQTIADLERGVRLFVKIAHWGYGSYLRTFLALGKEKNLEQALLEFPLEELGHSDSRQAALHTASTVKLESLAMEERQALGYAISQSKSSPDLAETQRRGHLNSQAYLFCEDVQLYLAGSMRPGDFDQLVGFSGRLRDHFRQRSWNPVVFDPTLCWFSSPTDKGLLESLMLKRCKMGVVLAGESDTFGKDSETAHLLAHGKPVVVLLPDPDKFTDGEKKKRMEDRFELYRRKHPLRLQVSPYNGVAYGITAVKDEGLCFEVIDDLLLHSLKTDVDYSYHSGGDAENGGPTPGNADGDATALLERRTDCVIRVITKDYDITHAFWNRYFEREVPAAATSQNLRW